MKIRLVEPKARSNNVYDHSHLPRLGLPQMAAVLGQQGHDVLVYVETLAPVNWDDLLDADLVGFSTTTGTTPPAYDMADRVRAAGIPVVFGGAHVTFFSEEALAHADYVVRGEGHITLVELVDALESPDPLYRKAMVASVAGLSYHGPDGPIHNPPRPNCSEDTFAALPWPALDRIAGIKKMATYPVMTQWGCPYDCNFCSVIKMFGRRVRARPVEDVLDQLEGIPPGKDIFFYDDNFIVDKRRTKALLRGMLARGITIPWSAQMRAEAVFANRKTGEWDTELLELMRDTHCHMVYVGFESFNPAALEEFNKHQSVDQIIDSISAFHAYGISVHGMFVLGCDADTLDTIETTVQFAIDHHIDTVQFLTITPLPGTEFYQQMADEDRILSTDWSLYDGHHVLIQPKNMTPYELQRASLKGMLRFYAPRRAWGLLIRNIFQELPFLFRLFIREQKLRVALPRIIKMAFDGSSLIQIPALLSRLLDTETWKRLRAVFVIPMFRRYAYYHTRQGTRQPENRRYFQWLKDISRQLRSQQPAEETG